MGMYIFGGIIVIVVVALVYFRIKTARAERREFEEYQRRQK